MRTLAPALTFSFFLAVAFPATADKKAIDIRNMSEKYLFRITFAAESSTDTSTGHAFVIWAAENEEKLMSTTAALGLYPGSRNKYAILLGGAGKIYEDWSTKRDVELSVQVTSVQYKAARAVHAKWKEDRSYQLFFKDCVSYLEAVADAIGLQVPSRLTNPYPEQFLRQLQNLNI